MSSAPPAGGQEKLPDPVLAAAVRIQRRRHRWALAMFWIIAGFVACTAVTGDANSNGTPPPPWFYGLTVAFGAGAGAAVLAVVGYSVAMHRKPAQVRAQAILLERRRIRNLRWPKRAFILVVWTGAWLGIPLWSVVAVVFVIALINAVAYLAGAGQVVRWAAIPVTSGGDAAVAIIVGLLLIFSEALLVYWVYRRATRVWWPVTCSTEPGPPVTRAAARDAPCSRRHVSRPGWVVALPIVSPAGRGRLTASRRGWPQGHGGRSGDRSGRPPGRAPGVLP